MMTIFRDKQVRLAMLLLYGLAALCLSLAHAERIFAEPAVDRTSFCLSDGEPSEAGGLPDCGLCSELAVAAPALSVAFALEGGPLAGSHGLSVIVDPSPANEGLPVGSRAPPKSS